MPIPYMGSKRKSAQMIFNTIKNHNPEANTIVDLFCGGFAISEWFIKKGWNVISNDKNKYVVALINKTITEGLDEAVVTKFVSREDFTDIQRNPKNYEDWYVGYVQCIWSFGNNQKNYLFGRDKEPIKLAGHKLVIDKNPTELIGLIPQKYIDGILKQDSINKRRIALSKVAKKLIINNLFSLQQIQQLENLQRLENPEVTALSYNEVDIPEYAIIYCDPPYAGTAEYKEGSFNHKEFWEWVRVKSLTNKIYVSEYTAPNDFKAVLEFSQKSTLQGGQQKHNAQPNECLFTPIGQ